ncbi:MAG: DUF1761 domain-containing protein [Bacteroidetes bacterium]|nr:DUF1761 domain-containing protein [Bacteroidota bacterium]
MQLNFPILAASALIPLALGFIWYNPKVFGKAWMKSAGMTDDTMKGANMILIFALTYVFSFFLAMGVNFMVIHQWHLFSMVMNDPGMSDPNSAVHTMLKDMMAKYGNDFRSYRHGALHGFIGGVEFSLPIIGINALFERKSFKYVAINVGFWVVCITIMGALICHFR